MAGHSTTAVSPFCISALLKWYVGNVPFAKAGSAGPAANVLLPVSSTKVYLPQTFQAALCMQRLSVPQ